MGQEEKRCEYCEKEYVGISIQKYCSSRCREQARNRRLHPSVYREKRCEHCGKEYEGISSQKYCGSRCRDQAQNRRRHPNACREKRCEYCGKEYVGDSVRKYCCLRCRNQAQNRRRHPEAYREKRCEHCGKEYVGFSLQKYCSSRCKDRARNVRENPEAYRERTCEICGKVFGGAGKQVERFKYCSFECHEQAMAVKREEWRRRKQAARAVQRFCWTCGKKLVGGGKGVRHFCSDECRYLRRASCNESRMHRCIRTHNPDVWRGLLRRYAEEIEYTPPHKRRAWLVCGESQWRGFEWAVAFLQSTLQADPYSGDIFVFIDHSKTKMHYLEWDGGGFCVGGRHAQRGSYPWPNDSAGPLMEITEEEFLFLRSRSILPPKKSSENR